LTFPPEPPCIIAVVTILVFWAMTSYRYQLTGYHVAENWYCLQLYNVMEIICWLCWYVVFCKRYDDIVRNEIRQFYYMCIFTVIYRDKLLPSAI
jgi:hypothetical protein